MTGHKVAAGHLRNDAILAWRAADGFRELAAARAREAAEATQKADQNDAVAAELSAAAAVLDPTLDEREADA